MAQRSPHQKRVKIHWEARWETYNHSGQERKVEQFSGEDMEPRCRIFAQQKALELYSKWSSHDHKTRVTVHEVETWEEELGFYTYKSVMADMTKARHYPDLPQEAPTPWKADPVPLPDPEAPKVVTPDPNEEIPF